LLLPHYPYAFDETCHTRPPTEWRTRTNGHDADVPAGSNNTRESRAVRYGLYAQQLVCLQGKLAELMDAIPDALQSDAIVLVQGDHGSRISLVEAEADRTRSLAPSDYADHFSALFAVRAPGLDRGMDAQPAAVSCLLRSLVESGFRSAASSSACAAPAAVFLRRAGLPPQRQPLPEFWADAQVAAAAPSPQ
jgi:hypothetical protein